MRTTVRSDGESLANGIAASCSAAQGPSFVHCPSFVHWHSDHKMSPHRLYVPLDCPTVTGDWDRGASAPGGDETGRTHLVGHSGQARPTTDVSRITDSSGSDDVDIQLLDAIEGELEGVERALAELDEGGP